MRQNNEGNIIRKQRSRRQAKKINAKITILN